MSTWILTKKSLFKKTSITFQIHQGGYSITTVEKKEDPKLERYRAESDDAARLEIEQKIDELVRKGFSVVQQPPEEVQGGVIYGGSVYAGVVTEQDLQDNAKHLADLPVKDYDPKRVDEDVDHYVFRFRSDWDNDTCKEHLEHFLAHPSAARAKGLVIGQWATEMYDVDASSIVNMLVDAKEALPNLRAIYLGDITSEENEMSWIQQADVTPLLVAFPELEQLRVRGSEGLSINPITHSALKALTVESGGLSKSVVENIQKMDLPSLEHLELWIGTDDYGRDLSTESLSPLLSGELFPALTYLGLRNSDIANELAKALTSAAIVSRLNKLDLSLGTMNDEGAEAILPLTQLEHLHIINLHRNFISPALTKQLVSGSVPCDISDQQEPESYGDEVWRYVAVGE